MASGCGKQEQQPVSTETQAQGMAEQAKEVSQEGAQTVSQVQENVQAAANGVVEQAQTLLAQAKELVNSGKFDEAIAMAQKVLSMDPNNIDAKNIIETAKAKLAAMAQQKAGELKNDLTNKINALGN